MTEQQIREQTQAVFNAYLALSRCGISLSDFLELRREAIQELHAVSSVENVESADTALNHQKKKQKKEIGRKISKPSNLEKGGNDSYEKPSPIKLNTDIEGAGTMSEETGAPKGNETAEEGILDRANEPEEEYNDFLDEFSDPWN